MPARQSEQRGTRPVLREDPRIAADGGGFGVQIDE
jgi:hypothetical protein